MDPERFHAARHELAAAMYRLSIEVRNRKATRMSFTGYKPGAIKAAIADAKKEAQRDLAGAMGDLAMAQRAAAEVPVAVRGVAAKIRKEAADGLSELAEWTNGGPLLEDDEDDADETPATPTPLPPAPTLIDQPATITDPTHSAGVAALDRRQVYDKRD